MGNDSDTLLPRNMFGVAIIVFVVLGLSFSLGSWMISTNYGGLVEDIEPQNGEDKSATISVQEIADSRLDIIITEVQDNVDRIYVESSMEKDNRAEFESIEPHQQIVFRPVDADSYEEGTTISRGVYDKTDGEVTIYIILEDGTTETISYDV